MASSRDMEQDEQGQLLGGQTIVTVWRKEDRVSTILPNEMPLGLACCCLPLRIAVMLVAAVVLIISFLATVTLHWGLARAISGGFSETTSYIVPVLGVVGMGFAAVGLLGAYESTPSFVRLFHHFLLFRLVAEAIIFVVDLCALHHCEEMGESVPVNSASDALMLSFRTAGVCGEERGYYLVWEIVDLLFTLYTLSILRTFLTYMIRPAYAIGPIKECHGEVHTSYGSVPEPVPVPSMPMSMPVYVPSPQHTSRPVMISQPPILQPIVVQPGIQVTRQWVVPPPLVAVQPVAMVPVPVPVMQPVAVVRPVTVAQSMTRVQSPMLGPVLMSSGPPQSMGMPTSAFMPSPMNAQNMPPAPVGWGVQQGIDGQLPVVVGVQSSSARSRSLSPLSSPMGIASTPTW